MAILRARHQIDSIEGDVVNLRPNMQDTRGDWFYFAFRVRHAQGRTLQFVFDHDNRVGARGPAVSLDGGKSWKFLSDKPGFNSRQFRYEFGPDDKDVRFATSFVYTQADWDRFLSKRPRLKTSVLCKSRKGRDVELLRLGNAEARFGCVLTARHHCCEMMANFVIEGILEEVLSGSGDGAWLAENVSLFVVPFVDKDGVEEGDQGKNRRPHDHNRDYHQAIYPEIRAIKQQVPEAMQAKDYIFLDLHCPWLRGGRYNEALYSPGPESPKMIAALKRFSDLLEARQKGDHSVQGEQQPARWPRLEHDVELQSSARCPTADGLKTWAATRRTVLGGTFEVPYANAEGAVVDDVSCREQGRNMAKCFRHSAATWKAQPGMPEEADFSACRSASPQVRIAALRGGPSPGPLHSSADWATIRTGSVGERPAPDASPVKGAIEEFPDKTEARLRRRTAHQVTVGSGRS